LSAQEEVLKSLEDGARSLKEAAIELSSLRDTFTLSAEKNVLAATAQQDAATKNQLVANQFDLIGEKLPQVQESVSAAAQVIASLGQPILNLKDVLEKAQEQLGDQAKGQATRDEQFTGMLLEQTKNLVNAVSNAAEQFLEIKTLAASLGESSKSLENAGKWLSDLSENIKNSAEQYVAAAEASEKAAAAGERAATKLEPIPASVAALTDSLSEAGGKIKLGADSANGIYLQLITYQKQWFDGVKLGLTSMRDQLQTIIEQYGDSVSQETQKHMSDWTKAVNDSLGKFSSQVDSLKEDINSLEETIEDLKTD
jgi:methyl-accepting chemotaxis protein